MIQTKKYNCIFLDRDGTLNPDPGYISSIKSFGFYDFTLDALRKISSKKNVFCIISNQSGVGRGLIKKEDLEEINDFIKENRNEITTENITRKISKSKPENTS